MTREEAIKGLTSLVEVRRKYVGMQTMKDEIECLDMAIKALEQEPCGNDINVPATDAISRQAVLNILDDMVKDYVKENDFDKAQGVAWVKVQKLPSVTPQPKTGHWVFDEILDKHYYCSECKSMGVDYWDYCPNCGAKMQEVEE